VAARRQPLGEAALDEQEARLVVLDHAKMPVYGGKRLLSGLG
jgi:hypothetical protein